MGCVERVQKNVDDSESNTILFLNILANLVLKLHRLSQSRTYSLTLFQAPQI